MKQEYRGSQADPEWRTVVEAGGTRAEKMLNLDASHGTFTKVVKMLPGYRTLNPEVHDYWEEVYYLDGELIETKRNIKLKHGSYECIPPQTAHGPFETKTGCELLVIAYPAMSK